MNARKITGVIMFLIGAAILLLAVLKFNSHEHARTIRLIGGALFFIGPLLMPEYEEKEKKKMGQDL
ncbi:hypothetical protein V1498_03110 [Peribacillus sp. SCS-26]|uniref:hypothetical protein n=1 Tax=Paraperibacillus marinus TaxID=3115295 RepID=UPI00390608DA